MQKTILTSMTGKNLGAKSPIRSIQGKKIRNRPTWDLKIRNETTKDQKTRIGPIKTNSTWTDLGQKTRNSPKTKRLEMEQPRLKDANRTNPGPRHSVSPSGHRENDEPGSNMPMQIVTNAVVQMRIKAINDAALSRKIFGEIGVSREIGGEHAKESQSPLKNQPSEPEYPLETSLSQNDITKHFQRRNSPSNPRDSIDDLPDNKSAANEKSANKTIVPCRHDGGH
ncbi:hypothetical protein WN55_00990 [Dufourea novaeangliae]|uniref:Uncharacterized protein n=1 Tax=Dufourea novaeangliae TaxID=178035 RepID=A0A154PDM4_DUFNO|nr:hypothetical protein WN55_00990 [Dufourea novaeangliae]